MNNYKSYSELQEELGENYPFKLYEMGISALKEIEKLQQELQRKDNNWNELKEWVEKQVLMETPLYGWTFKSMLNKIKELEENK